MKFQQPDKLPHGQRIFFLLQFAERGPDFQQHPGMVDRCMVEITVTSSAAGLGEVDISRSALRGWDKGGSFSSRR